MRGVETQEAILRNATVLFGRLGLRKTTMTDIADAAGISKATIYLYFKNKAAIFSTIIRRAAGELLEQIEGAVTQAGSVAEKLRAFILTRYRNIQSLLEFYQADPGMLLEERPAIQEAAADYARLELELVQKILEDGRSTGELEMRSSHLAAQAITGTLRSLDRPWIFMQEPFDLEQNADDLVHLFLHGLTVRKENS